MSKGNYSEKKVKYYLRKTTVGLVAVTSSFMLVFGTSASAEEVSTTETTSTTEKVDEKATETTSNEKVVESSTETPVTSVVKPKATLRSTTAANYQGTVTLVGQWTGESSVKQDSTREYTSADDKLGMPLENRGTLRHLAKTFLGWSDKAPVGNGELAPGAKLFSSADTIEKAFPNGITDGTKLYAVYFSLNDPDSPFGNFDLLGFSADSLAEKVNENKVTINTTVSAEETLPDTPNRKSTELTDNTNKKEVIDQYEKKDDAKTINEVVLSAEFGMNDTIAMLVYKNPVGSNAFLPILSRDYNTRYTTGEFSTADGEQAGYTYVDLNVSLDNDIVVPEKLFLEFKGYSWRPLYVFDNNKTILSIFNPNTGATLGNDKNSFSSLVSNKDPKVTFGVETNNAHNLTVRMVLREGANEKIAESDVKPTDGKSVAEEILSNMTLRALTAPEVKAFMPNATVEEVHANVLRITDARAKQSADANTLANITDTLKVSGSVNGHAFISAGGVRLPIIGNYELASDTAINKVESNVVELGYVTSYKVTHEFKKADSVPSNIELPQAITDRTPANQVDKENGTEVTPSIFDTADYVDTVNNGVWKFVKWDKETDTINKADVHFVGTWEFVANPTPEQPDTPNPENPKTEDPTSPEQPKQPEGSQKPKEKKSDKKALPKTGTADNMWVFGTASATLLASLGLAIRARKEN